MPTHHAYEWGPGHWGYHKGWGAPHSWHQGGQGASCSWGKRSKVAMYNHNQLPCLAANPQGKYAGTCVRGNSRRRMGSPSLHGGFCSGLMSLSTKNLWALMYPLQLLTGNMPHAAMLGMLATTQLQLAKNWHQQLPSPVYQRHQHF